LLFNSSIFLVFLVIVVVLHYSLPSLWRRYFLLLASYVFYWFWDVQLSLLLVASTVVDYLCARVISGAPPGDPRRKMALVFSMVFNLGLLGLFKYADFFSGSIADLTGVAPWPMLDLILPLGISFYTFQTMSYTIDVYRGKITAFHDVIDVALYVSFFPQLVAGPIIRADVLVPQIHEAHNLKPVLLRAGIALVVWGLCKKVFFADAMAPIVNEAYASPDLMSGLGLLTATYAFAAQIYFDFSGYTDIAIGSALMLGVQLPKNFDAPYLSLSLGEFWRRWHISLSTWLRDYLYISLGGSKRGPSRTYFNLLITMTLGGLWHGAGLNWLVWGIFHGVVLSLERIFGLAHRRAASPLIRLGQWVLTFHLVCFSWILFRADSLAQAGTIMKRIATLAPGYTFAPGWPVIVLALLIGVELCGLRAVWIERIKTSPRLALLVALSACVLFPLIYRGAANVEFIYFQF
jgi:D-alanyl-lipoteichoic acid acyltransferase DltB (MBOAT superfamily)